MVQMLRCSCKGGNKYFHASWPLAAFRIFTASKTGVMAPLVWLPDQFNL
jgi:hypothetical protein